MSSNQKSAAAALQFQGSSSKFDEFGLDRSGGAFGAKASSQKDAKPVPPPPTAGSSWGKLANIANMVQQQGDALKNVANIIQPGSFPLPPGSQTTPTAGSSSTAKSSSAPEPAKAGGVELTSAQAAAQGARMWQANFYRRWFDVDTFNVIVRTGRTFNPLQMTFISDIQPRGDIYGPFWIGVTLSFVMAVVSNVISWMAHNDVDDRWEYDMNPWPISATVIFGLDFLIPFSVWGISKWYKHPLPFVDYLCIYGYSQFVFIPLTIISITPNYIARWVVPGVGYLISMAFLLGNIGTSIYQSPLHKTAIIFILAAVFVFHSGFFLYIRFYILS